MDSMRSFSPQVNIYLTSYHTRFRYSWDSVSVLCVCPYMCVFVCESVHLDLFVCDPVVSSVEHCSNCQAPGYTLLSLCTTPIVYFLARNRYLSTPIFRSFPVFPNTILTKIWREGHLFLVFWRGFSCWGWEAECFIIMKNKIPFHPLKRSSRSSWEVSMKIIWRGSEDKRDNLRGTYIKISKACSFCRIWKHWCRGKIDLQTLFSHCSHNIVHHAIFLHLGAAVAVVILIFMKLV